MTKALAMVSGGLDSILAALVIKELGIDVLAICFKSAFFSSENAERMTKQVGLDLKVIDFTEEHLDMTKNPKYGYGKNMNPCIDCHAMMMRHAGSILEELNADFIITGEVLNQRPMSQNIRALDVVKKESGFEKKILRPLCAKRLQPTEMELSGLVDREKLLGISGRSRKPQMELAKQYGIKEYPSPAGGCCLTEPNFARRLKNLYADGAEDVKDIDLRLVELLKVGRHIILNSELKLISTRDKDEYDVLMNLLAEGDYVFNTAECNGSTIVAIAKNKRALTDEEIEFAARVTVRYSKDREKESVLVKYYRFSEERRNNATDELESENHENEKYISAKAESDEILQLLLI